MNEYRVTKYDPQYRVNGAYTRQEWTSVADVALGRVTREVYEAAEAEHVDFLCEAVERCGAFPLTVDAYEGPDGRWHDGQAIRREELPDIARAVLREECWCRLVSAGFFVHFGYDYYMYLGCGLTLAEVSALASGRRLYCEAYRSPWHDEEDDA